MTICTCVLAAVLPLFENGATAWSISVDTNAAPPVRYAAKELAETLNRVSGAKFAVTNGVVGPKIVIGSLADDLTREAAEKAGLAKGDDAVCLKSDGEQTFWILGDKPRAALYATYWFLQTQLGVRWLWPGEDGAFYPKRASYALPDGFSKSYRPPFAERGLHPCGSRRDEEFAFRTWMVRNMMNFQTRPLKPGEEHLGLNNPVTGHNLNLNRHKDLLATHPEYFAEVKGERIPNNICLSCDAIVPIIAGDLCERIAKQPVPVTHLTMSLNDNGAYCQCAKCTATDRSTAFFRFLAKMIVELKKTYPDIVYGTIAYQGYRPVPKCALPEGVVIDFCTHWRCNLHLSGDKTCPDNVSEFATMDAWDKSDLPRVGEYGYDYDVFARNGVMLPNYSVLADAIKSAWRRHHPRMYTEIGLSRRGGPAITCSDVQQRVSLHEYASLLWDPSRSLDDWMDDFCRTAYGPASDAMIRYFKTMDRAWTGRKDVHTGILGDGINSVLSVLTDETRRVVAEAFRAADAALAGDGNERYRRNVLREKQLYGQWEDLYALRTGNDVSLKLPRLADAGAFADGCTTALSLSQDGQPTSARVRAAWTGGFGATNGALVVEFAGLDAEMFREEASVELGLANAAEKWTFKAKDGVRAGAVRMTDLGVPDPVWKPQGWSVRAADGRLTLVIPFADVGAAPLRKQDWEAKFALGARTLPAKAAVHAKLVFIDRPFADRRMMFWTGNDADEGKFAGWVDGGMRAGYRVFPCRRITQLQEAFPGTDVFMFRRFDPQHMTDTYYKMIGEAVANGATVILWQSVRFPLAKAFGGLTRKSEGWEELKGVPHYGRTCFEGLLMRPYGKGRIVLMSGTIKMSPPEAAAAVVQALEK